VPPLEERHSFKQSNSTGVAQKKEVAMEKAAKEITPEEIMAEAKEAPSRLRAKLRELEAIWERASTQFFQAPKL